jgi:3-deoxy-D-manno-octulosonic-acid transferase
VTALARKDDLHVQQFTQLESSHWWDVLVVDTMGVLSTLYCLANVAFVGGTLVSKGGQNPLEPAVVGCPVMFGPDMSDFPDIAKWLLENSAAQQVSSGAMLGERWLDVLSHADVRTRMREACHRVVQEHQGATVEVAAEISRLVDQLKDRAPRSVGG